MDSDDIERRRRSSPDRRTGHDRRGGAERRSTEARPEESPFLYVHGERRSGEDRRQGGDRRSGLDRRGPEHPQDQIRRALDLVAFVAESTELTDEERRALDSAIMRLRFALDRLARSGGDPS